MNISIFSLILIATLGFAYCSTKYQCLEKAKTCIECPEFGCIPGIADYPSNDTCMKMCGGATQPRPDCYVCRSKCIGAFAESCFGGEGTVYYSQDECTLECNGGSSIVAGSGPINVGLSIDGASAQEGPKLPVNLLPPEIQKFISASNGSVVLPHIPVPGSSTPPADGMRHYCVSDSCSSCNVFLDCPADAALHRSDELCSQDCPQKPECYLCSSDSTCVGANGLACYGRQGGIFKSMQECQKNSCQPRTAPPRLTTTPTTILPSCHDQTLQKCMPAFVEASQSNLQNLSSIIADPSNLVGTTCKAYADYLKCAGPNYEPIVCMYGRADVFMRSSFNVLCNTTIIQGLIENRECIVGALEGHDGAEKDCYFDATKKAEMTSDMQDPCSGLTVFRKLVACNKKEVDAKCNAAAKTSVANLLSEMQMSERKTCAMLASQNPGVAPQECTQSQSQKYLQCFNQLSNFAPYIDQLNINSPFSLQNSNNPGKIYELCTSFDQYQVCISDVVHCKTNDASHQFMRTTMSLICSTEISKAIFSNEDCLVEASNNSAALVCYDTFTEKFDKAVNGIYSGSASSTYFCDSLVAMRQYVECAQTPILETCGSKGSQISVAFTKQLSKLQRNEGCVNSVESGIEIVTTPPLNAAVSGCQKNLTKAQNFQQWCKSAYVDNIMVKSNDSKTKLGTRCMAYFIFTQCQNAAMDYIAPCLLPLKPLTDATLEKMCKDDWQKTFGSPPCADQLVEDITATACYGYAMMVPEQEIHPGTPSWLRSCQYMSLMGEYGKCLEANQHVLNCPDLAGYGTAASKAAFSALNLDTSTCPIELSLADGDKVTTPAGPPVDSNIPACDGPNSPEQVHALCTRLFIQPNSELLLHSEFSDIRLTDEQLADVCMAGYMYAMCKQTVAQGLARCGRTMAPESNDYLMKLCTDPSREPAACLVGVVYDSAAMQCTTSILPNMYANIFQKQDPISGVECNEFQSIATFAQCILPSTTQNCPSVVNPLRVVKKVFIELGNSECPNPLADVQEVPPVDLPVLSESTDRSKPTGADQFNCDGPNSPTKVRDFCAKVILQPYNDILSQSAAGSTLSAAQVGEVCIAGYMFSMCQKTAYETAMRCGQTMEPVTNAELTKLCSPGNNTSAKEVTCLANMGSDVTANSCTNQILPQLFVKYDISGGVYPRGFIMCQGFQAVAAYSQCLTSVTTMKCPSTVNPMLVAKNSYKALNLPSCPNPFDFDIPDIELPPPVGEPTAEPTPTGESTGEPPACDSFDTLFCMTSLADLMGSFGELNGRTILRLAIDKPELVKKTCDAFGEFTSCVHDVESTGCEARQPIDLFVLSAAELLCNKAMHDASIANDQCLTKVIADPTYDPCAKKVDNLMSLQTVGALLEGNKAVICKLVEGLVEFTSCTAKVVEANCPTENAKKMIAINQNSATKFKQKNRCEGVDINFTTTMAPTTTTLALLTLDKPTCTASDDSTIADGCYNTYRLKRRLATPLSVFKKSYQSLQSCDSYTTMTNCLTSAPCLPASGQALNAIMEKACTDEMRAKYSEECYDDFKRKDFKDCPNPFKVKNVPDAAIKVCNQSVELISCAYDTIVSKCSEAAAKYSVMLVKTYAMAYDPSCSFYMSQPEMKASAEPSAEPEVVVTGTMMVTKMASTAMPTTMDKMMPSTTDNMMPSTTDNMMPSTMDKMMPTTTDKMMLLSTMKMIPAAKLPSASEAEPQTYTMTISLPDEVWDDKLSDNSSTTHTQMSQKVLDALKAKFGDVAGFNGASIKGFSKGSVQVQIQVNTTGHTADDVKNLTESKLASGKLGDFNVKPKIMNISESNLYTYESCSIQEVTQVRKCVKPFNNLKSELAGLLVDGLKGLGPNVVDQYDLNCKRYAAFEDCIEPVMKNGGSSCKVYSCLITGTGNSCSQDGDMKSHWECLFQKVILNPNVLKCGLGILMKYGGLAALKDPETLIKVMPDLINNCAQDTLKKECGNEAYKFAYGLITPIQAVYGLVDNKQCSLNESSLVTIDLSALPEPESTAGSMASAEPTSKMMPEKMSTMGMDTTMEAKMSTMMSSMMTSTDMMTPKMMTSKMMSENMMSTDKMMTSKMMSSKMMSTDKVTPEIVSANMMSTEKMMESSTMMGIQEKTTPTKDGKLNPPQAQGAKDEVVSTTPKNRAPTRVNDKTAMVLMVVLLAFIFAISENYYDFSAVCGCFVLMFALPSALIYLVRNFTDSIPYGAELNAPFKSHDEKYQRTHKEKAA